MMCPQKHWFPTCSEPGAVVWPQEKEPHTQFSEPWLAWNQFLALAEA